jgi:cobyrinic acid a,c-diamide synthase
VVAGTHSGVGKTTVATGIMAALRRRGLSVASAKVGPDFIDPGYHSLATGRPARNLDAWICGTEAIGPLAAAAGAGAEVTVVEGVMGLFDGAATPGPAASTAEVAHLLQAPVILVVDAASMSTSVGALVHGFTSYDPALRVGGVILNRVGSSGHEELLREALVPLGIAVLGVLMRDTAFAWRDRHLGLVPVTEDPDGIRRSLDRLADAIAAGVDLDAVLRLARSAPPITVEPLAPARPSQPAGAGRVPVAVASGAAFSFCYPDNLERLEQAGAELVPFDPRHDPCLPPGVRGLYAGGGFPEVFAGELAANQALLGDIRRKTADEGDHRVAPSADAGGSSGSPMPMW